jgi:hypothetical protein
MGRKRQSRGIYTPPAYFNGVTGDVGSALTIIPVTQILKALSLRNSIGVDERTAFTAPHEAAKSFVDAVMSWAAQPTLPERGSSVSTRYTDAKGRVAEITLDCPDANTFPRVSINSLLSN